MKQTEANHANKIANASANHVIMQESRHHHRKTYWGDFLLGSMLGALGTVLVVSAVCQAMAISNAAQDSTKPDTATNRAVVTVSTLPKSLETSGELGGELEDVPLGPCRITAYCACELCCGEWARNRPDGIVRGASGMELEAGVSCASPWPMGTVVEIEGLGTYIVQDRPAQWVIDQYGENQFDLYFDSHEAARNFGLRICNVTVKQETGD